MDEKQRATAYALATGQLNKKSQYNDAGEQLMVEPRQSALQRIQVGLIGLVVVLLFVSLANMVLDRVIKGPTVSEAPGMTGLSADKAEVPGEPLAELGVTPVAKEETLPTTAASPAATNNVGQAPTSQRR
jgi:hypothetical protein